MTIDINGSVGNITDKTFSPCRGTKISHGHYNRNSSSVSAGAQKSEWALQLRNIAVKIIYKNLTIYRILIQLP